MLGMRDGALREVAPLPTRAALGAAMVYHGVDKLRGKGPEQTTEFFETLGIQPGRPFAVATGIAELGAGILTLAGIGTRVAAAAVLVTQATAIAKVHGKRGYSNTRGGFEYNAALIAIALGLLLGGPDKLSTKHLLSRKSRRRRMMLWRRMETPRALQWLQ